MRGVKEEPMARFVDRVEITDDCWLWTGARSTSGYPTFNPAPAKKVYAHRWLYGQTVGSIPKGLQLDHLCFTPTCVNPDHLEAVTPAENKRRMRAGNAAHCPYGHPYSASNTYIRPDTKTRMCKACKRRNSNTTSTITT